MKDSVYVFLARWLTFAAGCSTSNRFRIVAPSFVTVTSPMSSTNILSRPRGPKLDFTMLAIDTAAITFCVRTWKFQRERFSPSDNILGSITWVFTNCTNKENPFDSRNSRLYVDVHFSSTNLIRKWLKTEQVLVNLIRISFSKFGDTFNRWNLFTCWPAWRSPLRLRLEATVDILTRVPELFAKVWLQIKAFHVFTFSLFAEKVAGSFEKVQEHSMRSRAVDAKTLVRNKLFSHVIKVKVQWLFQKRYVDLIFLYLKKMKPASKYN